MNAISPIHFPEYLNRPKRSNVGLACDAINWFLAFTLTTFVILFLLFVVVMWVLSIELIIKVVLFLAAFSGFVGIIGLLFGILFVGGIKHIPQFSWKKAVTLQYSFFRIT